MENENFVKEFEKTVDRVLKNCYDGHGQRNDCGVRRLKMEKNMKSKIVVDSSANVHELPDVGFACVPLKILTGEQEYVDNAEVDAPALAEMLRTYKGRTSTSCPTFSVFCTLPSFFRSGSRVALANGYSFFLSLSTCLRYLSNELNWLPKSR